MSYSKHTLVKEMCSVTAIQRVKGLTCFSDDVKESVLKHTVNHSNTTALKILFKEYL